MKDLTRSENTILALIGVVLLCVIAGLLFYGVRHVSELGFVSIDASQHDDRRQ